MYKFSIKQLREFWLELGDIPINDDEEIEADFIIKLNNMNYMEWKKGTDRYEIWHWFDNRCPNNLHDDIIFGE